MPSVLPRTSREPVATFLQTPSCTSRDRSPSWRASMTISAMTISATLRVLENGALKTGTPRFLARSSSTWLVPMQKQPRPTSSPPRLEHSRRDLGLAADAEDVDALQAGDELVFLERAVGAVDLEPFGLQQAVGHGVNRLEQQDLQLRHGGQGE